MFNSRLLLIGSSVLFALATACQSAAPAAMSTPKRDLLVFAASSLTDAFGEAGKAFEATHPGVTVANNFAATSTLRTQLSQGAKADVFASADSSNMTQAQTAGLIEGAPANFATNRLAIVVPANNPKITSLRDLAKPGIRIATTALAVPSGAYANQVLDLVDKDADYGADFIKAVRANIVTEAANVRAAIATTQIGETDASFSYTTDVAGPAGKGLRTVLPPDKFHVPVTYPLAAVRGAPQLSLAQEYVTFIRSAQGQAILAKWGFQPPPA